MLIYQLLKSEYPFCGKISPFLKKKILEFHILNNQLVGCITVLNEIFCEL